MHKLVFVVGTRAQLIKMAPVLAVCEQRGVPTRLIMTGQHFETIDDLREEFNLKTQPVWVVTGRERATIFSLLAWVPAAYRGILRQLKAEAADGPIDVLVHGDTLSTLLAALAARRCGARVVHVESGLTSGKLLDPFPEEIFRRIVFRVTDVAMCPNEDAAEYMKRLRCGEVINTQGNTIVDAVRLVGASQAVGTGSDNIVVSLHRFQNIYDGARLRQLEELIVGLSKTYRVHFILHPATRKRLDASGAMSRLQRHERISLSPRLGYGRFLRLAAQADCVLTDGGSNQEELAVLGVPTIVMRASTERPDGLGRNAIMESDAAGGVLGFLERGEHRRLRFPADDTFRTSPSEVIVSGLSG